MLSLKKVELPKWDWSRWSRAPKAPKKPKTPKKNAAASVLLACTLLLAGLPALAAPLSQGVAFTDPPRRTPPSPRIPKTPTRRKGGRR